MKKLLQCVLIFFCTTVFAQDYINNSLVAFTIPEKDLLPENIAYNPLDNSFYMGSTRKGKVIKIDATGNHRTFIEGSTLGLWMIIGMKVDADRNVLWVCSSGGDNLINYSRKDDKEGRPAGIFKFDLTSGNLLQKFVLDQRGGVHFFNDLVLARNGDVYATHMFGEHAIYKISAGSDKLEKFVQNDLIKYPNGITLADNQSILFVAHSEGLARIDIKDKKVTQLSVPEGINVAKRASIDGLYYYKWSLIGIQPDVKSVTRYYLNDAGDGIKEAKVLEYNHPMLDHPTTGVMQGKNFYYIANSQFEKFNEDGTLFPNDKLYEVVVLKLKME